MPFADAAAGGYRNIFAPEEPDEKEPAPHTDADTHCRHGIDVYPDRPSFGTVRLFNFPTTSVPLKDC